MTLGAQVCLVCGKDNTRGKKFCSLPCYWQSKIGKSHTWGYKIGNALRGVPKSPEHIKNAAQARKGKPVFSMRGENHPFWKGDNILYGTLHDFIHDKKGYPKQCEHCGKIGKKSGNKIPHWNIHWANKSRKYTRDLSDWIALCRKCHYRYDKVD